MGPKFALPLLLGALLIGFSACSASVDPEPSSSASVDPEPSSSASVDPAQSSSAQPPVSTVVVADPAVEFEASLDFLDAAAERMATTPHRFEVLVPEMDLPGPAVVGESDGAWSIAALLQPSTDVDEPLGTIISNGVEVYMDFSSAMRVGLLDSLDLGSGESWALIRHDEIEAQLGAEFVPTITPRTFAGTPDMWGPIRDPFAITEGAMSTIRGVETRTIVIDNEASGLLGDRIWTVVIHIDAAGYVRSIVDESGRTEFFDIGSDDITVTTPIDAVDVTENWIAASAPSQVQDSETDSGSNISLVSVPSVLTMTGSEAAAALEAAGLEPSFQAVVSDASPDGQVVGQDPAPGVLVEPGAEVLYQVVSIGEGPPVPDVRGMEIAAARELLVSQGFLVPNRYQTVFDDEIERDLVVGTFPERAQPGTEITIVLSNGPQN